MSGFRTRVLGGAVVLAVMAGGVFLALPFRGALAEPDCAVHHSPGELGPGGHRTTVDVGAVLDLGTASFGLRGVGTSGGVDAARVSSATSGPEGCVLRLGTVYRIGEASVRLDAISPNAPWQDLFTSRSASATFTVSRG